MLLHFTIYNTSGGDNMLKNNYLSVLMFQLNLHIECTSTHDYLVVNEDYHKQLKKCIEIINELEPDIVIFPEMACEKEYADILLELSKKDKLIVFGSTYIDHINYTVVYNNGELNLVQKRFPCGSEPMVRYIPKISPTDFVKKHLAEHEFHIKGQKVYVLNCLEYYETAYMIARDPKLSSDLFGFIVPCSNSNPKVFMDESKALHNHNEFIYSFVTNRIRGDNTNRYGRSYIYGPIQYHEKDWLKEEGIESDVHNASILNLDKDTPSFAYGRYAVGKELSRFGRSDCYLNTPLDVTVKKLF